MHSLIRRCALLGALALCWTVPAPTHGQERSIDASPVELAAEPFPLRQVELLPSPFRDARERNARFLISLDPDRLLHNARKHAGLRPKGALYGGWEARGVAGHTLGHYLTALSQHYAATGDARFRDRVAYVVREMAECQRAYGDGYVGALPPLELETLRGFRAGRVEVDGNFNFAGGAWVPWYTQHKVLAGLRDAWVLAESAEAKGVALGLANWVDEVTRGLSPEQCQTMLRVEHGGMNEVLLDLHALTGDRRYLDASRRFYHEEVMRPLLAGRDELPGKHANTQIPKVIGEARRFEVTGDEGGREIARFFWDRVVNHHSYAIGGNSENEHFGRPDRLADRLGPATAETCNTYNMLKLTRHLFAWRPEGAHFDFYERALYNHILASQEPRRGMFAYFVSLAPGHFRTYSAPSESFWCCVGSGIENHTKYNDSIYFRGDDALYVNLFVPSRLRWEEKGLVVELTTAYPRDGRVELRVAPVRSLTLAIRVRTPWWAAGGARFAVNGRPVRAGATAGGYAEIRRTWSKGDVLRMTIPMRVRAEATPDDPTKVVFLYGPLVLAGDLGPVPASASFPYAADQGENFRAPRAEVPVLVTRSKDPAAAVRRVPGAGLVFRTAAPVAPRGVTLRPFNELAYNYHTVYWDVLTPAQHATRAAALREEAARRAAIAARTVDEYRPGEQQSEVDHAMAGERTTSGDWAERKWRHAEDGGWFAFRLKVLPDRPVELVLDFWGGETGRRTFDVLVDGTRIATETLSQDRPGEFFEKRYAIPEALTRGKGLVEVRLQAHPGNMAGGLYGARTLRGPF